MPVHVNESAENYLETILMLSQTLPVVRSVDIATELNFKKSSVSVAMKKLRENHHIVVSPEGYITLTESGKEIADRIYERHTLLSSWLKRLGVDPQVAVDDACRIEHVISAESLKQSKSILKKNGCRQLTCIRFQFIRTETPDFSALPDLPPAPFSVPRQNSSVFPFHRYSNLSPESVPRLFLRQWKEY